MGLMIRGVTEGRERRLPTARELDNAVSLLRVSIQTMFSVLGNPDATTLHFRHPDGANIRADLSRMLFTADTLHEDETHFFSIDGKVDPSNGQRAVRTDARRKLVIPPAPELSRYNRISSSLGRLGLLNHSAGPAVQPQKATIEYDYLTTSEVDERQVMRLFTWAIQAMVVEQKVEVAS